MGLSDRVASVVAFLRAGYPSGAPALGYTPLLALVPRRVSDDEVTTIAKKLLLVERRSITNVDVGVEITRVTDELPSISEIERVRRRLTATGWAGHHRA
ncbi:DUF3349 domain-containing protein [Mycobacterium sp. 852014-50255_SCH5639931]|uniref:DUF3349 domain-containing protein n=1 Tax=Mycobacterium sp. 852014-50255_SCH5639931 TaxID=1834112 RepID=UPI0007FFA185|nr:DUF3349 domain-containing protein [Mycobacterium sp. 852014-50255_SCH5639931]OBB65726.1 hypothetical protein A5758_16905 [Mycobacterium sp. 852014-50255_SCH5639931]